MMEQRWESDANVPAGTKQIAAELKACVVTTAEKAKTTLGWQTRPVEDSIAETAQSLIERGLAGAGSR